MANTIYDDLNTALTTFKTFLDTNAVTIKPIVTALKLLGPQVGAMLNSLVTLMGQLKTEIQGINVPTTAIGDISTFANAAKALLTITQQLMPSEQAAISQATAAVDAVAGLQTFTTTLQTTILAAIQEIIDKLNFLNS